MYLISSKTSTLSTEYIYFQKKRVIFSFIPYEKVMHVVTDNKELFCMALGSSEMLKSRVEEKTTQVIDTNASLKI